MKRKTKKKAKYTQLWLLRFSDPNAVYKDGLIKRLRPRTLNEFEHPYGLDLYNWVLVRKMPKSAVRTGRNEWWVDDFLTAKHQCR